jgi:hypothetical protein
VILFRFIAKANYWDEDTAYCPCHIILHQSSFHVSDGLSQQRFVSEHTSFHLAFVTLKNGHFARFSPGTFHSPVSILMLVLHTYTMTTTDATQSHDSAASLTKTFVWVCLKNINEEPSWQVCVFISRKIRICIWVWTSVRRYVVKEETDNYTVLKFSRNYPLVSVVKLVWNVISGREKGWTIKYYVSREVKRW